MPVFLLGCLLLALPDRDTGSGRPWTRHTIDRSSRGADGIRIADVNGDGALDIATGWEEGGIIRAYLNPGPETATRPWPAVTVGEVKSPEDAVFVDLDGDGNTDVVSSCEGRTRTMFFHWSPADPGRFLETAAWRTQAVPVTQQAQSWMFALPLDIDGRNGIDLIVSSKGAGAGNGWLESPAHPRDVTAWKYHKLRDAGWIMSLDRFDMDKDGDMDLVATDRKGTRRGAFWLEHPGPAAAHAGAAWKEHFIGGRDQEVMFIDVATSRDGFLDEILVAAKPAEILRFRRADSSRVAWLSSSERLPRAALGTLKAVRKADLNLDGIPDLVVSCEQASGDRTGLAWLQGKKSGRPKWSLQTLAGATGIKFDLIQLLDLDADGDLDVICCEERANLGVFWYENPTQSPRNRR